MLCFKYNGIGGKLESPTKLLTFGGVPEATLYGHPLLVLLRPAFLVVCDKGNGTALFVFQNFDAIALANKGDTVKFYAQLCFLFQADIFMFESQLSEFFQYPPLGVPQAEDAKMQGLQPALETAVPREAAEGLVGALAGGEAIPFLPHMGEELRGVGPELLPDLLPEDVAQGAPVRHGGKFQCAFPEPPPAPEPPERRTA